LRSPAALPALYRKRQQSVNYTRSYESEESNYQPNAAYPRGNECRLWTAPWLQKCGPKTRYRTAACADQESWRANKDRDKEAANMQNLQHLVQYNNLVTESPKSIERVMHDYEAHKSRR
jgi:hypothetical protein